MNRTNIFASRVAISALLGCCLLAPGVARAVEIKVLAVSPVKETYLELLPQFEKSSGNKVITTWAGSADFKKRIAAGEVYDLMIAGVPMIETFIQNGKIEPGSRVDLMKAGVGVAVRAGAPKPDISSSETLKTALLTAKSIGYSTGSSGVYVASIFERMGIADQIGPKLKQTSSGVPVGKLIASGEAEIGFQQISELIHVSGIDYVGPLPADLQKVTVYAAAIHGGGKEPDATKALVQFLTGPAATQVIKKNGMEPG